MKIVVNVIDGPAADRSFAVDIGCRCVVGRSENADFRITNDPLISREHFSIAFDGAVIALTDLGSTNGTFVDGVALVKDRPVGLRDGQRFIAGRSTSMVVQLIRIPQSAYPTPSEQLGHADPSSPSFRPPTSNSAPSHASPIHSPFYDSTDFNIHANPPPTRPPLASPSVSPIPAPTQPTDSRADSGNFSQSIVSDYRREPRLGNASDLGPSDQGSLLFNNFASAGSGELFTSGISDDRSVSRNASHSPLPPIDSPTTVHRPSLPDSPDSAATPRPLPPPAAPLPSRPLTSEPVFGSIAPPGMGIMPGTKVGNRASDASQFTPLAIPPPRPASSNIDAAPPFTSIYDNPPTVSPPNNLGAVEVAFSPDQSTPVHPRSPRGEIVSRSVGMPDQVHEPAPRLQAPQFADGQENVEAVVAVPSLPFEVKEFENGVFVFSGRQADELKVIIESLQKSYESLFIVDLARAGFEPEPPSEPTEPSPSSESKDPKVTTVDDRGNKSAPPSNQPASLEIESIERAEDSESNFLESAEEPTFVDDASGSPSATTGPAGHQSPFDDDDGSVGSPFEHAASAKESRAKVGTPLYHWLPTSAQRNGPLLLTADEFAGEDFGIDLAELWQSDALICLFGSSAKQLTEHSQNLVRMDLRTGKSGKAMFGFCWPSVLDTTLESQPEKTIDRIFAGGVAAIFLEDPQQEFAWRVASKMDLTETLRTALKSQNVC